MKNLNKTCAARLFFVLTGLLFWASPAVAFWGGISGSPNPNTGNYTVSWLNSGYTFYLEENPGGTSGWTTIITTTGTSYEFTDKTPDAYMYRLRYRNRVCTGWPEPECTTTTTYSETTTVNVLADDGITSPPTEGTAGAPGSTVYAVDVDTSGDAIIRVPINVIPGVAKFRPYLSLEYDSGRGIDRLERSLPEDTLGYGWRLAGLSQIRR